jgi:hypothetical protein
MVSQPLGIRYNDKTDDSTKLIEKNQSYMHGRMDVRRQF